MIHFEVKVGFEKEEKTILDDIVIYISESVNEFCANPDYLQKLEVAQ